MAGPILTYSITNDTLNGAVAFEKLSNEIRALGITIALEGVSNAGDVLSVEFRDVITSGDETLVNAAIAAHDGNPGLNDPSRFQIVGADGLTPADVVDDNGVKRLEFAFSEALTGPAGPAGADGVAGPSGFGVYAFSNTTAAGTISKGRGLTINKTGTGTYQYSFTTATPDVNYIVSAGFENLGTNTDTNWFVNNKTVNGFTLTTGIGDNGTTPDTLADTNHNVAVLGDAGPQGITSAYESWLDIGNTGTEADFLATLVGPQGPQGPQGNQGNQGLQGNPGNDGADGADGKTILNGTVDPTTEGVDGDFYINTTSDEIFGPKTAGSWGSGTSLVGPQGPQGPIGPASTFGSEYNLSESLTQSSTNSTTFQNKVTLNLTSLPPGTYRLNWGYFWALNGTGDDFEAEIRVDGIEFMSHRQEPKDAGTDQNHAASGFIPNLSLNGNHTITLNYRTDDGAVTAFIEDARLEIWRIS